MMVYIFLAEGNGLSTEANINIIGLSKGQILSREICTGQKRADLSTL